MALAKRPGERYATAAEMAEDLRAFLDGGPLKARRESAAVAMARLVRRYRRVAVTSSLVALGFLVLSVYAALRGQADWHKVYVGAARAF